MSIAIFFRVQRCEHSGLLPPGAQVQVLQPAIFQANVLQDLPGTLSGHRARPAKASVSSSEPSTGPRHCSSPPVYTTTLRNDLTWDALRTDTFEAREPRIQP